MRSDISGKTYQFLKEEPMKNQVVSCCSPGQGPVAVLDLLPMGLDRLGFLARLATSATVFLCRLIFGDLTSGAMTASPLSFFTTVWLMTLETCSRGDVWEHKHKPNGRTSVTLAAHLESESPGYLIIHPPGDMYEVAAWSMSLC